MNRVNITVDARIGVRRKKVVIESAEMQPLMDFFNEIKNASFCEIYEIKLSLDLHKDARKQIDYVQYWLKEGLRKYVKYFITDPYEKRNYGAGYCQVADFVFRKVTDAQLAVGDTSSDRHIANRQHPTKLDAQEEWLRTLLLNSRRGKSDLAFLHVYAILRTKTEVKLFVKCLKAIYDLWE